MTLNLIAFVGAHCNVQGLSVMCERSGGLVANVEGNKITDSLTEMLTQKIVASKVTITIKLHKFLRFRNEPASNLSND